jgi:DNA gyrase subunit A
MDTQGDSLLIVSENGIGKRTPIEEFHLQKRGGKGVKCYKINEKTGYVIGVKAVNDDHEVMLVTNEGIIIQIPVDKISKIGRITSGVKLIDIDTEKNIKVAKIAKVRENPRTTEEESVKLLDDEAESNETEVEESGIEASNIESDNEEQNNE